MRSAEQAGVSQAAVNSQTMTAVEYEEASQMLEIVFQTGAVYRYHGVPRQVYTELMAADSKGAYFNKAVRRAFPHQRVK